MKVLTPRMIQKGMGRYGGYIQSLYGLSHSPFQRAKRPLHNHAWVYIAAMIRAVNMAQAPLVLYRETDRVGRAGDRRSAVRRHLTKQARFRGLRMKDLVEDYDHEIAHLLMKPNDTLSQSALLQITSLWLSLRGECFWVMANRDDRPIDKVPDELWPMSPDLFEPIIKNGRLEAWWMQSDKCNARGKGSFSRIRLELHEVIQFKYANPEDPYRGITPISAAAAGIDLDLMADARNKSILENDSDPGGILFYDGDLDPEEEEEFLNQWEEKNRGPQRSNRTNILKGNWKYIATSLTPQDMQHIETKRWNREMIFGIMRVPKSTAGITDDLNYATQVGQDKNLWDKSILPDVRLIEGTLDATLFYEQRDNILAAFDLTNIEALRHGLSEQIDEAKKLMTPEVHMPPGLAFEMVGLTEVPDYPGKDVSLVNFSVAPLEDVLSGALDEPPPQELAIRTSKTRSANGRRAWQRFIRAQIPIEKTMRRNWRAWVQNERDIQLEAFDREVGKNALVNAILVPLEDLQRRIGEQFRPSYTNALEAAFDTVSTDIGGVPIFELDDPRILEVFERRMRVIRGGPPATIQRNLTRSLVEGLQNGESLGGLRQRVAEVFRISASSGKSLTVARTESAGLMNGGRDAMFVAQGFQKMDWVTAGDEHVRESHELFGSLGPKEIGYNYLLTPGYSGSANGTLAHPGDPNAGASESANCRCVRIPAE